MHMSAWWKIPLILIAWTLCAPVQARSLFRAPADTAAPFRREALPLDVDTMTSLSRQLTNLGIAAGRSSEPATRRAGAQLFALATALDPANRQSREAAKRLEEGNAPELPANDQLANDRTRAWSFWSWLTMEQADPDAQAFAACLGDALATADPEASKAEALHKAGEKGRWSSWVPDLSDYQPSKPRLPGQGNSETPDNGGKPGEPKPNQETPRIRLKTADVVMFLNYSDSNQKTFSGLTPVHLNAWTQEPAYQGSNSPFSIQVAGVEEAWHIAKGRDAVLAALHKAHGNLPTNGRVALAFGNKLSYSVPLNDDAFSGPAAVLANAALTGKAPPNDLIIFGAIRTDGKFGLLKRPWEPLLTLNQGSTGRLIVPKDALDLVTGLLVLEKPQFFLRHEVFMAANFTELVEQATPPADGPLAEAIAKFAEIRSRSEGKQVGQFVANPFTRQRLGEITQLCPNHLSARLLFLQASGKRPVHFSTPNLAREIRRCLTPLAWIASADHHTILAPKVETTHAECRKELDAVAYHTDFNDRSLHEQALALVNSLRTMARIIHHAGGPTTTYVWGARDTAVAPQIRQFHTEYTNLFKRLDELSTDNDVPQPQPPPPPPPKPQS